MAEFNPYAAPTAPINQRDVRLPNYESLWQDDDILVMRKGAELPDRCLKCNAVATGSRLKRKLSWHPPAWYLLLLLLNPILYLLAALCVRRTAKVAAPFCARHRAKRRWAIAYGWLGSVIGLGVMIAGGISRDWASSPSVGMAIFWAGIVIFWVSLIVGVVRSQYLVPQRIDKDFVRLKKVCPEFLESLPEWQALG